MTAFIPPDYSAPLPPRRLQQPARHIDLAHPYSNLSGMRHFAPDFRHAHPLPSTSMRHAYGLPHSSLRSDRVRFAFPTSRMFPGTAAMACNATPAERIVSMPCISPPTHSDHSPRINFESPRQTQPPNHFSAEVIHPQCLNYPVLAMPNVWFRTPNNSLNQIEFVFHSTAKRVPPGVEGKSREEFDVSRFAQSHRFISTGWSSHHGEDLSLPQRRLQHDASPELADAAAALNAVNLPAAVTARATLPLWRSPDALLVHALPSVFGAP
ncbi:hypothetical protein R3P38DRAFT_2803612 [Favolaschia claudopus]|uniref:Uncharacterized protein n=1 Tax=Favolaschia claudopus TaxID=2862362 RepID=A0AAV9ZT44_9AGAR